MSKDATLKLQKEQFASSQLSPVMGMARETQGVMENDTNRYVNLLSSAGKAVSDLRTQKAQNRERIFNTGGTAISSMGDALGNAAGQLMKMQAADEG
jgi:hypothetical protein